MTPDLQNNPPTIEQVADLLTDIASDLMTSGAHTMRIIQNISRMAGVFGYNIDLSVFQLTIMMTITDQNNMSNRMTIIKKTKPMLLNFTFVSDLSGLSWNTYDKQLLFEDVKLKYKEIMSQKRMSRWLVLILVAFANASFCGLFKGDFPAMLFVFVATIAGFFVRQEMTKMHVNHLVMFSTSAFVASLIAGLSYIIPGSNTPETAMAASVLYLIPGVPLINSILDIIEGHILTGIARLVNATSLIVCIALGMFMSMLILGLERL